MATDPDKLDELLAQHSTLASVKDRPLFPKSLIYGRPKIGKTTTMSRVGERPLLLAVDPGWSVLRDWPELAEKVTVDEVKSVKHWKLIVEALKMETKLYKEFDHIITDPFNKLVQQYIDFLQENLKPSTHDARVYWTPTQAGTSAGVEGFTTAGMGDYMAVRNHFRTPVYQLTSLPRMVTFICHAAEPGITDKSGTPRRAALPGKTYEMLAQEVDFIGYMEANGANITISLSPSDKEDAGSRVRALHGKKIKAESFPNVINKWRNGESINV